VAAFPNSNARNLFFSGNKELSVSFGSIGSSLGVVGWSFLSVLGIASRIDKMQPYKNTLSTT
jgi:hypothetical protein